MRGHFRPSQTAFFAGGRSRPHWFRLAHHRTATASFFFLRELGQQVRPVPSDNAACAVVYNIDAVEGLNLTADDFKVVWTEAATVEKFHWHGRPIRKLVGSFRT